MLDAVKALRLMWNFHCMHGDISASSVYYDQATGIGLDYIVSGCENANPYLVEITKLELPNL